MTARSVSCYPQSYTTKRRVVCSLHMNILLLYVVLDSMEKRGLAHPHQSCILLPYRVVFNQQEGYRYTTRVSECWILAFPYGKDYSNKPHVLELHLTSAAKEAHHIIISYHHINIIFYETESYSLSRVFLFCLIFACWLAARSAFPMYVNLHGHSVHESLEVLLWSHWLFSLPMPMKVGLKLV